MKKKTLLPTLLLIHLLAICSCASEKDTPQEIKEGIFSLSAILKTDLRPTDDNISDPVFAVHGDEVWALAKWENSVATFEKTSILQGKSEKIAVQLPHPMLQGKTLINDMSVSDSIVAILFDSFLAIARIDKDRKTISAMSYKDLTDNHYMSCFASNTHVYLCRCYNFHPLSAKEGKTHMIGVNASTGHVDYSCKPSCKGIEFTHFFKNRLFSMSPSGKYLVFSNTVTYDIRIFDSSLREVFHISAPEKLVQVDTSELAALHKGERRHPREIIDKLRPAEESGGERIRWIHFASDSTLLVMKHSASRTSAEDYRATYNFWTLKNDKWEYVKSAAEEFSSEKTDLKQSTFPVLAAALGMPKLSGNQAVIVVPALKIDNVSTYNFKDYFSRLDAAFAQREQLVNISIFVYSLKGLSL